MSNRRRLTPEQRRDELLDVGADVFTTRPFEEVAMEDVARRAQVSRALMYHYFATKGEFFGAIWKREHDRLLTTLDLRPGVSVRVGVEMGLSAHLDFYESHVPLVLIANRSAIAAEPAVRGPVAADMVAMSDGILDACAATGRERSVAAAALAGWVSFVREVALEWLLHQRISRAEAFALMMNALDGTVGSVIDLNVRPQGVTADL